jgi:hypothetical protein
LLGPDAGEGRCSWSAGSPGVAGHAGIILADPRILDEKAADPAGSSTFACCFRSLLSHESTGGPSGSAVSSTFACCFRSLLLQESTGGLSLTPGRSLLGTVADFVASARIDLNLASRTEPVDNPRRLHDNRRAQGAAPVSVALMRRCSDAVPPTRTLGISTKTPQRPRFPARAQVSVWSSGSLIALR